MKRTPKRPLRFASYSIVSHAVEQGISLGYRRAHKHTDTPSEDLILESVLREVMGCLDEVIQWEVEAR